MKILPLAFCCPQQQILPTRSYRSQQQQYPRSPCFFLDPRRTPSTRTSTTWYHPSRLTLYNATDSDDDNPLSSSRPKPSALFQQPKKQHEQEPENKPLTTLFQQPKKKNQQQPLDSGTLSYLSLLSSSNVSSSTSHSASDVKEEEEEEELNHRSKPVAVGNACKIVGKKLLEVSEKRASEKIVERTGLLEKAGEKLAERAGEKLAGEKVAARAGEKLVERAGEKLAERAGEKLVEKAGEKLTERAGQKLVEKVGEKLTERAGEKLAERAGEKLAERAAEKLAERTTELVSEKLAERAVAQTGDRLAQQGAEKLVERATEQAADRIAERAVEQATEKLQEKAAKRVAATSTNRASEQFLKNSVELASNHGSSNALSRTFVRILGRGALIVVPIMGALFAARIFRQDVKRFRQTLGISRGFWMAAAVADGLDTLAHAGIVGYFIVMQSRKAVPSILENTSLTCALVSTACALVGEWIASRDNNRHRRKESSNIQRT